MGGQRRRGSAPHPWLLRRGQSHSRGEGGRSHAAISATQSLLRVGGGRALAPATGPGRAEPRGEVTGSVPGVAEGLLL